MVKEVLVDEEEYKELLERDKWLTCLEIAGVDNWDGIDYAQELMSQEEVL